MGCDQRLRKVDCKGLLECDCYRGTVSLTNELTELALFPSSATCYKRAITHDNMAIYAGKSKQIYKHLRWNPPKGLAQDAANFRARIWHFTRTILIWTQLSPQTWRLFVCLSYRFMMIFIFNIIVVPICDIFKCKSQCKFKLCPLARSQVCPVFRLLIWTSTLKYDYQLYRVIVFS